MTSLRDEVATLSRPARPECSVKTFLAGQANRSEWEEVFADPTFTAAGIHKAMVARGYKMSAEPVMRHKRRACDCARSA